MTNKEIIIPASANRVISALSNIGYSLQSSICDIVDNSISHGLADNIYIMDGAPADLKLFKGALSDSLGESPRHPAEPKLQSLYEALLVALGAIDERGAA